MNIANFFPYKNIREQQKAALSKIESAISDGKRFLFLQAPTGTGKSAVTMTLSKYYNNSVIVCHTKKLQKQYKSNFDIPILFGIKNYKCNNDYKCVSDNIMLLSERRREVPLCAYECEYKVQKSLCLNSNVYCTNYAQLFSFFFTNQLQKRRFVCFDEAHLFVSEFLNNVKIKIEAKTKEEKEFISEIRDYNDLIEKLELPEIYKNLDEDEYEFKKDSNKITLEIFNLKEIPSYLKSYYNIFLFMSATLNPREIQKFMRIKKEESIVISLPYMWKENVTVHYKAKSSINKGNKFSEYLKMQNEIKDILNSHKSEKGIIFLASYEDTIFFVKLLNSMKIRHKILYNKQSDPELLDLFKSASDPTVLVTPSFREGVDIAEADFIIIPKMPYIAIDKKAKYFIKKYGYWWYKYKSLSTLIQSIGRAVRSENDCVSVYFLDKNIEKEIRSNFIFNYLNDIQLS